VECAGDDVGRPAKKRNYNESTGCNVPDRSVALHRVTLPFAQPQSTTVWYEVEFPPSALTTQHTQNRSGKSSLRDGAESFAAHRGADNRIQAAADRSRWQNRKLRIGNGKPGQTD